MFALMIGKRSDAFAVYMERANARAAQTVSVQPFDPVPDDLPRHAAYLGCLGSREAAIDRRQGSERRT